MAGYERPSEPQFDIFEWWPKYQSCQRYFVHHSQHSPHVQAVAAFVNIQLPFHHNRSLASPIDSSSKVAADLKSSTSENDHKTQSRLQAVKASRDEGEVDRRKENRDGQLGTRIEPHLDDGAATSERLDDIDLHQAITEPRESGSSIPTSPSRTKLPARNEQYSTPHVSLIPYLRRLVATGMDKAGVLHGFFGDDWQAGIGPMHEQERRNYLFAAKSGDWTRVKSMYDVGSGLGSTVYNRTAPQVFGSNASGVDGESLLSGSETVPFLRPLQGLEKVEIEGAERIWSEWLAMEDWMVPAPDSQSLPSQNFSQPKFHTPSDPNAYFSEVNGHGMNTADDVHDPLRSEYAYQNEQRAMFTIPSQTHDGQNEDVPTFSSQDGINPYLHQRTPRETSGSSQDEVHVLHSAEQLRDAQSSSHTATTNGETHEYLRPDVEEMKM